MRDKRAGEDAPVVRAEVLAALCTDDSAQVHRMGVRLRGAVVEADIGPALGATALPAAAGPLLPPEPRRADAHGKELALDACSSTARSTEG